MIHKTSGLVLHTTKYSESGLIVKVYTLDFGLQSYFFYSGKNKRSKNKALFQPLALVEILATSSGKGHLQRITEINSIHPYSEIPYNIIKSSIVMFLNEVLYRSLKEAHPDEDLFEFLKNSLLILDLRTENSASFHIYFLIQLSRYLGFYPQGQWSPENSYFDLKEGRFSNLIPSHSWYLNKVNSETMYSLINSSYDSFHRLTILKNQRKELLDFLITYYKLHIASFGEIKSQTVLEEVIG